MWVLAALVKRNMVEVSAEGITETMCEQLKGMCEAIGFDLVDEIMSVPAL